MPAVLKKAYCVHAAVVYMCRKRPGALGPEGGRKFLLLSGVGHVGRIPAAAKFLPLVEFLLTSGPAQIAAAVNCVF